MVPMFVAAALAAAPEAPRPGWSEVLASEEPRFEVREEGAGDLAAVAVDGEGRRIGLLRVSHGAILGGRRTTGHGSVGIEAWDDRPETAAALIRAADRLAAAEGGWTSAASPAPAPAWPLSVGLAVFGAGVATARARQVPVEWAVRLPHALPAVVQTSLLVYWAQYWPLAAARAPALVAQVLFAFGLDAALSAWRRDRWVVGFSVVPIVLSMNLFLWFALPAQFVAVAVALLGKALVRREGRHIFNPSASALALVGLVSLAIPWLQYDSLAHAMNVPPLMAELILLLAVLPQTRLPIALVSAAAFVGLEFSGFLGPGASASRPSTLLALALLVTDPATLPQGAFARVLFGLAYGIGARLGSVAFGSAGLPDDLAKVLPVLACNLAVPWFDRLRAPSWAGALAPRFNAAHILLWLALTLTTLASDKARHFEVALHWWQRTPGIAFDADGVPTCAQNPEWCALFGLDYLAP